MPESLPEIPRKETPSGEKKIERTLAEVPGDQHESKIQKDKTSAAEAKLLERIRTADLADLPERKIEGKKVVIFDFDGTCVDAQPIFIEVFNSLAKSFKYAPIAPEQIPELRKLGAEEFIAKRLNMPRWKEYLLLWIAKVKYAKRSEDIQFFPEVKEVIGTLRRVDYRVGIVSSSQKKLIAKLLEREGIAVDFIYPSDLRHKDKAIRKALRREKLGPESVIYVGDEVRDMDACKKAGVDAIALSCGLNDREVLEKTGFEVVDRPEQLLEKLIVTSEV